MAKMPALTALLFQEQLYELMSIKKGWGSKGRNPVATVTVTEGFTEEAPFEQILEEQAMRILGKSILNKKSS